MLAALDGELIEEDYDDIEEQKFSKNANKGWFGIGDKYWISSIVPPRDTEFKVSLEMRDPFYNEKLNIDKYMMSLRKCREIDKIVGGTKFGPHKSDYIFFVDKNYPASQLSTVQQKTLVLLLYFSQCNYLVNTCNKRPILLLDEICSHLDETNAQLLLKIVNQFDMQVFMTGTNKDLFSFLSTNTNFCNISNK